MAWFVQALEMKDGLGEGSGIWHLCAESDEGGGFHVGCRHEHQTALEAQNCEEAKINIGVVIGFPVREDKPTANEAKEKLIKQMVDRFLAWKLPKDFQPDAGISFNPDYNEHTPFPARHEPSGTNLLNATQAEAMIRHLMDGVL